LSKALPSHSGTPRSSLLRTTCPYHYEIRDGKLFIEGEDFGDAKTALERGEKILSLVELWHEVGSSKA